MRNLCNIFRKLALGNRDEFREGIFSLYEHGSPDECDSEIRRHIKNCHRCLSTVREMGAGDKDFINVLLSVDIK